MKFGFIGDIVGKIGRNLVKEYIKDIRDKYELDFVIANGENASHGFGLGVNSYLELSQYGIDIFTSGNHIWDKRDILPILQQPNSNVLRPHNYPKEVVGSGIYRGTTNRGENYAVLNIMGNFTMPQCDNAFICARDTVSLLQDEGFKNIIIDFHAEASSEKRALFMMLKGKVSAIFGTHTHIGTDDLEIFSGTFGVSDVGLSGARESVIGMREAESIERFLTGVPNRFVVPEEKGIPSIFQMIICELIDGKCNNAFKIKAIDGGDIQESLFAIKEKN